MPVKIRCRGCEKILNAPDKARGRVIKCPHCETKLKVPAGDGAVQAKPAKAKSPSTKPAPTKPQRKKVKSSTSKPPGSASEIFTGLDLDDLEDREARICPFCAAEMPDDEDDVCPACGMNTATRQMDAKVAKKRARKGPDPSKFYKGAWGESLHFVKENKSLALRTGWYWTVFGVLLCACYFMAAHYCEKGPPITFWGFLALICALGIPGWYWFLSERIIQGTLQKQEKFDRIHFDFFQSVTIGSRAIFWPAVIMLPLLPVAAYFISAQALTLTFPAAEAAAAAALEGAEVAAQPAAGAEAEAVPPLVSLDVTDPQRLGIIMGLFLLFPLLSFPLAMVHQTAKYTYKAWVGWEMAKVFAKNVGPSLYWGAMALVTFIIPFGGLIAALELAGGGANLFVNAHFTGGIEKGVAWVFTQAGEQADGWLFSLVVVVITFVTAFAAAAPVFMAMGFPLLFLIRANSLLGVTFQRNLMLVQKMKENVPATFWVRLLAFLVDAPLTLLTGFLVTANKKAMMVSNFLNAVLGAGLFLWKMPLYMLGPLWLYVQMFIYFVVSEQTTTRTTVGKDGFGLIVSNEDDSQMTFGDASKRYICGLANLATCGVGFIMCAFHPEKKALNDIVSKTKVVWRGDR